MSGRLITARRFPTLQASLPSGACGGSLYPQGITIHPEEELEYLIATPVDLGRIISIKHSVCAVRIALKMRVRRVSECIGWRHFQSKKWMDPFHLRLAPISSRKEKNMKGLVTTRTKQAQKRALDCCPRCGGFMVPEFALETRGVEWHCVTCGERVDQVILVHRQYQQSRKKPNRWLLGQATPA